MIAGTMAKALPVGEGTRPSRGLELRDSRLLAYVNHVGNLVALHGERAPPPPPDLEAGQAPPKPRPIRMNARRFTFAVLDTDEVGAYSTPGGYVLRLQSKVICSRFGIHAAQLGIEGTDKGPADVGCQLSARDGDRF